jgi:outer membrane immunogenic protein
MLRKALLTSVFGLLCVPAFAADLPARMPVKAVPYVPAAYNWTGFYVGANLGYGWSSGSGTITIGGASGPYSGSGNGLLGGVQLGYNWQAGAAVFGIETDFQASGGRGDVNATAGATAVTATAKNPWFGTIRGRLGWAFDRWMVYATAGGLYGKATLDGTVNTTGPFSASTTYWTWVVGGGVEAALWDRWTGKIEYLYAGSPTDVPVPPGTTALSGSGHAHVLRAGLNYRF